MNRLRAALSPSRETRKAWGRFLLLLAILFIVMSLYASFLEVQGLYNLAEVRLGLLIELMGTFLTSLALFLNWDLPRIQDQEQLDESTQTNWAKIQESLEKIEASLASQQNQQPMTTPPIPVATSSTSSTLSRSAPLLIGTLLSAILIILLRRTHKP